MAERLHISVTVEDSGWRKALPGAARHVRHAARAAMKAGLARPASGGLPPLELGVALSDDERVRALNVRYRGIDRPTNVLSFSAAAPLASSPDGADAAPLLLGDVVLALQTVQREAGAQGKTLGDHVTHLTVHGVLHLLGFDHESEEEAEAMEALETRVLAGLGVADPYAAVSEADSAPAEQAVAR